LLCGITDRQLLPKCCHLLIHLIIPIPLLFHLFHHLGTLHLNVAFPLMLQKLRVWLPCNVPLRFGIIISVLGFGPLLPHMRKVPLDVAVWREEERRRRIRRGGGGGGTTKCTT
jgi:hypothetical protein